MTRHLWSEQIWKQWGEAKLHLEEYWVMCVARKEGRDSNKLPRGLDKEGSRSRGENYTPKSKSDFNSVTTTTSSNFGLKTSRLSASNGEENRKGRNVASWDGVHGTRSGRNDCKQVTRDDNNDDGRDDGRRFRHLKNYVYRVLPPPLAFQYSLKSQKICWIWGIYPRFVEVSFRKFVN